MEHVWPKLRSWCGSLGLQFRVVDMRWGVTSEVTDGHQTLDVCRREIKRCREKSLGPCFVHLATKKYGWRPLPVTVPTAEFKVLRKSCDFTLVQTDTPFFRELGLSKAEELLEKWYKIDEDVQPAVYRLVPISHVTGQKKDQELNRRIFDDVQLQLQRLMRAAVAKAALSGELKEPGWEDKWRISLTHDEVQEALADVDRAALFEREVGGLKDGVVPADLVSAGLEATDWLDVGDEESVALNGRCLEEAKTMGHFEQYSLAFKPVVAGGAFDRTTAFDNTDVARVCEKIHAYVKRKITDDLRSQPLADALSQEVGSQPVESPSLTRFGVGLLPL